MRWKLLLAFGGGFTLVFVVVAVWILRFSTDSATDRVRENLREIAVGGMTTIDADGFADLVEMGFTDPSLGGGGTFPDTAGVLAGQPASAQLEWPTAELYWNHINELLDIRRTNPDASPYSYVVDGDDIRFVGSWGAAGFPTFADPPDGARFMQPADQVINAETLTYFARGADGTTEQPAYSDEYGDWISTYTPIVDDNGMVVGVLGVDYPLSYVSEIRSRVIRVLYPVFGGAYVVLLVLVVLLSGRLTKRISRLSQVTQKVADGNYDIDVSEAARSRFADEMTALADAFGVMTAKVDARERTLVRQVQVLKVEIDEVKRQQAVAEITDSDFFADLTSKAAEMRSRVKQAADAAAARGNEPADGN